MDKEDTHEDALQKSLDRYSVKLIKVIGIIGAAMGLIILGVFWYWLLKKLF
jgi:hypothetical protein